MMENWHREESFLTAFGLGCGSVAAIIGAGGKTSLMFQIAREARARGMRVLVTTSTRIFVPEPELYDEIDLSGEGFAFQPTQAGIYVAGLPAEEGKLAGLADSLLLSSSKFFDLVLIEADGSKCLPLKGWKETEPVVPACTTHSIGVLDISVLGERIDQSLVHRLPLFLELTDASPGDALSLDHLRRVVEGGCGMFARAHGREQIYLNKVESAELFQEASALRKLCPTREFVAGSIHEERVYA
ncbi:selenium cofactor biosynthesis protein YqeC [Desulfotalea psychrophila]|uniref:Selenium-dependent hydroxylase accessory protein YqeC n=1 Tax=Desulfotalea psychrophila (strain LSv54 / DSM 12343) TaxID=177439 RepID=Q6AIN6_DESPS|nr:selenium cofactor biosynthesis protein YqeC [Desulfotalea psychrophila]CAG37794.1 hypothetical protein DP3065 [Desulfotalea psychrophila LSv54]